MSAPFGMKIKAPALLLLFSTSTFIHPRTDNRTQPESLDEDLLNVEGFTLNSRIKVQD
jgi:hypothetical protein